MTGYDVCTVTKMRHYPHACNGYPYRHQRHLVEEHGILQIITSFQDFLDYAYLFNIPVSLFNCMQILHPTVLHIFKNKAFGSLSSTTPIRTEMPFVVQGYDIAAKQ